MGDDPTASVVNACSRMHEVDNLYIADGSVFTSSGGFNPTNTIMALSLHMTHCIISGDQPVAGTPPMSALPNTGGPEMGLAEEAVAGAAALGGAAVARLGRGGNHLEH
jgi:hypothetical protein